MKTYVIYYSIKGEEERFGYEVKGTKDLMKFIKYERDNENAYDFEVYRIDDLNDRDCCTRMYTYEIA